MARRWVADAMLIGFEASALNGVKSGVGYYTEHILSTVMKIAPEHRYMLFSNRDLSEGWRPLGSEQLYREHYFPVRFAWMQAILPSVLRDVRPDVCHFTNYLAPVFCGVPYVVTVHDMSLFMVPRYHTFKKLILDRTLIPIVTRRADAVLTHSESAKRDIVRILRVPPSKVSVSGAGTAGLFRLVEDRAHLEAVRARYGLHGPYILYVGNIEPRKNIRRLVRALAVLKKWGLPHRLVIVGQFAWQYSPVFKEIERLGLRSDVVFTGYVPDEDLPAIYSAAESFVYPSLYEGFGLPLIEAMACGTPVVTANTSSLAEVGDGAALLINPRSVEQIADALFRLHVEPGLRRSLRERGLRRAADYTWEDAALVTLDVYEKVARPGKIYD
jgi:glycosyltransferase involved in cell wall biosynthesis